MAAQHDQARRDEFYRDPHPLYARARRAEGLVFVPEADAWLVARDRDVREVLGRAEEFSSANALTADIALSQEALGVLARGFAPRPTVVASDGADHRRLRAPLNRGLSSARVSALLPYAQQCARELVDAFSGDGSAELVAAYARQLPGQVVGRLIGLDPADVPAAVHGGYRAEELLFRPLPPPEQAAAAEDVVALQHLLDGYVRARRAEPRDDLCSDLVAALAPGDDELTLEQRHELVSNLQNLLIAGFLTTSALIGTTLLHLLADREQWRLLCADPALVAGRGGGGRALRLGRPGIPADHDPAGDARRYEAARRCHRARGVRRGQAATGNGTGAPRSSTSGGRRTAATSPSGTGPTAVPGRGWAAANCA